MAQFDNSVRSPIFYDSNDTNWYLNPASTTRLNNLTVVVTLTANITGDANTIDGLDSTQFLRSDTADTFTGTLTMGTQKALVANNYGRGVYGLYSPTRYQHVWGMGAAYNLPDNGLDESGAAGNFYGLAWSYNQNYSYSGSNPQAKSGLGHQLLLMMNGTTRFAAGNGMWTQGNVTADAYYDRNNGSYYGNFASTSRFNRIDVNDTRSDIFYDRNNTNYYLNPASGNTGQALKINGIINRD